MSARDGSPSRVLHLPQRSSFDGFVSGEALVVGLHRLRATDDVFEAAVSASAQIPSDGGG
jgi:hypothetical protein